MQKSGTGTTFKAITQNVIKNIEVPVPSLDEQERIVSKIEELFSKLDASVAELKTAKEKLKVYRQAVLKEAFRCAESFVPFGNITDARLGKMQYQKLNFGYLFVTASNRPLTLPCRKQKPCGRVF